MKKDVHKILKRLLLFSTPFIIWIFLVITIDPFNYFNISKLIEQKVKDRSSKKLNSLMYNCISFKNNPVQNVIIGDSRIRKFPITLIQNLSGEEYFSLYSNAAKLNEIIDLFWYAEKTCLNEEAKLKNVLIGLNFNLYNKYAYADRVHDMKEILNNPFLYIFNASTLETIYLSLKYTLFGIDPEIIKDKNFFWKHTVDKVATDHYARYIYPDGILERLKEISYYCDENSINLKIIIVPHHQDFHDKLIEYGLEEEEIRFKREISEIGRVIDFDYPNEITRNPNAFGDPLHTTESISAQMIKEIFSDSLIIGRDLHKDSFKIRSID